MEQPATTISSKGVWWWPWLLAGLTGTLLLMTAFVLYGLSFDKSKRPLALVIDPTLSAANAATAWSTNIGKDDPTHRALGVEVQRPDANTLHVTLTPTPAWHQRIDFWIARSPDRGLRAEGTSTQLAVDGSAMEWPVYNLVGAVRLSRGELGPGVTEPLYLAFDLNGHCAGSDAPHNGVYEIPATALR